ncbi:MAG: MFS transporter [Thermogemmata sp.]|nr:MFS transporter [Thermogemmata sp.]
MSVSTPRWLNRTVWGAGLTSFLSDVSHEMASAILPSFLRLLQVPPESVGAILGWIEGIADGASNAVKLLTGWYSDRLGRRKPFVVCGYLLTGGAFALCAWAMSWPLILLAKLAAWIGKGIRGPLRNAILADAVPPEHVGKAFGFHRAGDTLGAIVGPLLAAALLILLPDRWFEQPDQPYRVIFLLTLVPGLAAALSFAGLVQEQRFTPRRALRLTASIRALPSDFRRYLLPVFVFGIGDFSHALLILTAGLLLTPAYGMQQAAAYASLLYALRNATGALAAFPAGWLGDRCGRRRVLVVAYLLAAAVMLGFGLVTWQGWAHMGLLAALFALAGVYIAMEEALEPAITADLVRDRSLRGTAMGTLAAVNGIGDFLASVGVGTLFLVGPSVAFGVSAALMLLGAILLIPRTGHVVGVTDPDPHSTST